MQKPKPAKMNIKTPRILEKRALKFRIIRAYPNEIKKIIEEKGSGNSELYKLALAEKRRRIRRNVWIY